MSKIILSISGMSCSACSSGLEKYLKRQKGITDVFVNLVLQQASITYDDTLSYDDISRFIKEAGFENLGPYEVQKAKETASNKIKLIVFSILSILVMYISMSHMIGLPVIPFLHMKKYPINYSLTLLLLSIPYLIYGYDIFKSGYKNLIHKAPNMDTLVSIGVLSSFIYSVYGTIMILSSNLSYVENLYFESCCIVIYFIKLGRFIDIKSKEKTTDAIKDLVTITPFVALIKRGQKEEKVTLDEVKKEDVLICKAGMKIAVDGVIISGDAYFDESFITGESTPIKKTKNMNVVAGSLNMDGYVLYKAERIGKDTTISEIVRLMVEAVNTKAPISKIADKVSSVFVPTIMIVAFLTLFTYLLLGYPINTSLVHFVTILVVACPCALGLATPLAIVVSEGMCAKNGILVKTSEILENAHKVDTIVFDKTGTLTYGNLQVSKIYNYSNYKDSELTKIVASIEKKSTHPISTAFSKFKNLYQVENVHQLEGIGMSTSINNKKYYIGNNKLFLKLKLKNIYHEDEKTLQENGNSIIYVLEDNNVIALIGVKDTVRKNSRTVIDELQKMDKDIIMLTGDNSVTAKRIATELGIDHVVSSVLPKEKTEKIKELISSGKKVMMVGDGINDAPSLASATVGVSLSSGSDIAKNGADVILINNNLESIVNLIMISKKTITNIKQNLFWAFFYNICMIPIAMGLFTKFHINMNPMIASFAMTVSSLTVVFNALRIKKVKLRRN